MTAQDTAIETITRKSRRAVIAGALGGIGAWALAGVGKASPVHAEGQAVVVGGEYTDASSVTYIKNSSNDEVVIKGESAANGSGVYGQSATGSGVTAVSTSGFGLNALSTNGTGIRAFGGGIAVDAQGTTIGVQGSGTTIGIAGTSDTGIGISAHSNHGIALAASTSDDEAVHGLSTATGKAAVVGWNRGQSTGVMGVSNASADLTLPDARGTTGVFGYSAINTSSKGVNGQSTAGTGIYGAATSGYAIRGSGRVRFEKVSGVATIGAGSKAKTISPGVNVTSSSFVLLSPRASLGGRDLWFTVDASANTITIHISSARSSGTPVGWLLLS